MSMHATSAHARPARASRCLRAARPGLSLVEVVVSIAITGGLLASVFGVVGVSAQRSLHAAESSRAAWLARDLAAEIATKPCVFDNSGTGVTVVDDLLGLLGVDELLDRDGVTAQDGRAAFNDVYDYDTWSSTPPVGIDGVPIPGFEGWTRAVDVDSVDPATLSTRAFDPSCMLIKVTVSARGRPLHTEYLVRTNATDTLRTNGAGADADAEAAKVGG